MFRNIIFTEHGQAVHNDLTADTVQPHRPFFSLILVVSGIRFGNEGFFSADKPAGMLIPHISGLSIDLISRVPMNSALKMVWKQSDCTVASI
jgi:hypothetical protein